MHRVGNIGNRKQRQHAHAQPGMLENPVARTASRGDGQVRRTRQRCRTERRA